MKKIDYDIMRRISEDIYMLERTTKISHIADKLGCSRRALYSYRDMDTLMSLDLLRRLCDLTGRSADYYLYGEDKTS